MTIYTMSHKAFNPPPFKDYVPLQVGSVLHEDLGFLRDDSGDSISEQNPYYSELTGLYWIWKNDKSSDIVGTAHYRRYLVNKENQLYKDSEVRKILSCYDLITTKLLTLEHSYYDAFGDRHNNCDLDVLGEVINELAPDYHDAYNELVHKNRTYFGNMIIAKKETYNAYMEFLFPILFEAQKRIDMSSYDGYQKRLFGFFSEFLLYVYVKVKGLKVYESQVGMISEKTETKELKEMLAGYFSRKDIEGAKNCFMSYYNKRPDILMEASDLNHECRLGMQAISSLEWELKTYGCCRLFLTTDFYELIHYYEALNNLVNKYPKDIMRLLNQYEQNNRTEITGQKKAPRYKMYELAETAISLSLEKDIITFLKDNNTSHMELKIALALVNFHF